MQVSDEGQQYTGRPTNKERRYLTKRHKVTIEITEAELSRLEDYLVCSLDELKRSNYWGTSLGVWRKLVEAVEKK